MSGSSSNAPTIPPASALPFASARALFLLRRVGKTRLFGFGQVELEAPFAEIDGGASDTAEREQRRVEPQLRHLAMREDFPLGIGLRTCSAEDLVVLKAFAGRGQDWVDVERIIVRQTGKLDWNYIREQLQPLAELKEMPDILDQLERRRVEFEQ